MLPYRPRLGVLEYAVGGRSGSPASLETALRLGVVGAARHFVRAGNAAEGFVREDRRNGRFGKLRRKFLKRPPECDNSDLEVDGAFGKRGLLGVQDGLHFFVQEARDQARGAADVELRVEDFVELRAGEAEGRVGG